MKTPAFDLSFLQSYHSKQLENQTITQKILEKYQKKLDGTKTLKVLDKVQNLNIDKLDSDFI